MVARADCTGFTNCAWKPRHGIQEVLQEDFRTTEVSQEKSKQSFLSSRNRIVDDRLFLPKLKTGIKIVLHRELIGKINSVSITKTSSGKYFASFQVKTDTKLLPPNTSIIGIDLGIKNLIITSDGEEIPNPQFYRSKEKKLAYQQRQLSKKQNGSKNKEEQRLVVVKLNEDIVNCRKDYLHKLTKRLINENQVIICENLNVAGMLRNHCLAKSISDVSWYELTRQLKYKAEWYGRTFHQIDRWFPSSKTCNNCQYLMESLPLDIRSWCCPQCKQLNDRDINASLNIRDRGLKDLELPPVPKRTVQP